MPRKRFQCYPDLTAFTSFLDEHGGIITPEVLAKAIRKHRGNSGYNLKLCERYEVLEEGVPIFRRKPRFADDNGTQLNNRLNNDFFSEIIDFKTGYFAGSPVTYAYSQTKESESTTGSSAETEEAAKVVTDFTVHANMYDVDMQCVKHAAICGYGARLFYIDPEKRENVMSIYPYQAILLSDTDEIYNPKYGIRYWKVRDMDNSILCKAEFYNSEVKISFSGSSFGNMQETGRIAHGFHMCPLQGIPNNSELVGDAENVLSLIDAYDRCMSDCSNEVENFAQSYMVFENVQIDDPTIQAAQASGSFHFWNGAGEGKIYYLTKDINDTFLQNYADRLEKNIFHRSKTPDLSSEAFGTASGISLKFKLTELETKCGMLEAKMSAAGMYMFRLLSQSWKERLKITVIPEQCCMSFSRNFPLDELSEAQAVQAMVNAGLPKRVAFENGFSFIDDIDYVMDLAAKEEEGVVSLYQTGQEQ